VYNSFAPYEQDFREWWQSRAYPDVNPLTRDFLIHLTRPDAPRRLWRHQEEAVMRAPSEPIGDSFPRLTA